MEFDSKEFYCCESTIKTVDLMHKFGGSFASALANTYRCADSINRCKIYATWPELFEEYGPNGIFWGTEQKEES